MRLTLFLLFNLALLAPALLAQPGPELNATDAKGRKQGTWSKSWPNGKTRYMGQFKDDTPVGKFTHYTEEGTLATIQVHGGDGQVSRAKHYHTNGTLMAEGKYVGQAKDSTWNYYGPEGQLRKVERFVSGKLHGEQVTYYPSGAVAEREMREKGALHGPNKSWFNNGNLKTEATYRNGQPEGKMTFYFPSGKKEIEGNMVNGDRDGTWFYFNEDATIQLQMLYAKGVLVKERKENGKFTEYYDDEQVKSQVTYKKGRREGPAVEFYDNGQWVMRTVPPDPMMGTPGDAQRELKGQTKKWEGTYKNDLLEGEVKEYDEKGKVLKVRRYVEGVEVGSGK